MPPKNDPLPGFISRHFIEGASPWRSAAFAFSLPGFISRHFIEGGPVLASGMEPCRLPGFISRHFIEGPLRGCPLRAHGIAGIHIPALH